MLKYLKNIFYKEYNNLYYNITIDFKDEYNLVYLIKYN